MYFQAGDTLLFECEKPKDIEIQKTDVFFKGANHLHRLRGNFAIGKHGDQIFIHSKGCGPSMMSTGRFLCRRGSLGFRIGEGI